MINYLFENLVSEFDEITFAMVSSKFHTQYKQLYDERIDRHSMNKIIRGFFVFIYGKYGIKNDKVMRGFANSGKAVK